MLRDVGTEFVLALPQKFWLQVLMETFADWCSTKYLIIISWPARFDDIFQRNKRETCWKMKQVLYSICMPQYYHGIHENSRFFPVMSQCYSLRWQWRWWWWLTYGWACLQYLPVWVCNEPFWLVWQVVQELEALPSPQPEKKSANERERRTEQRGKNV